MNLKKFFDYVLYAASTIFCLGLIGAGFYFFFYQTVIAILLIALGLVCWQTYKFAKIIMVLEDDLSDAIEVLKEVEDSMNNVLEIKLFFDTPEVQQVVHGVMNSVRMAKFELNKTTKKFIDRSKQKYVTIIEESPAPIEEEFGSQMQRQQQQGGTIADVQRIK